MELALFNSDILFKIATYLPVDGLRQLSLTCRRWCKRFRARQLQDDYISDNDDKLSDDYISHNNDTPLTGPLSQRGLRYWYLLDGFVQHFGVLRNCDENLSLIEETARRVVQDIATKDDRNELPCRDGENWLLKYNYLQSLRLPLAFDQIVGVDIDYVKGNKSCVVKKGRTFLANTAFSNSIMMGGKHYASFEISSDDARSEPDVCIGVMRPGKFWRPGKPTENMPIEHPFSFDDEVDPLHPPFYNHFIICEEGRQYDNDVDCCMYSSYNGECHSSEWDEVRVRGDVTHEEWDGMEGLSPFYKIGMLLDLNEGTLSVYKNGRRLGLMKRGLAGRYCWVVKVMRGTQVTIKRGPVPAS